MQQTVAVTTPTIKIPADLLPADGRFGCGPSKVRQEAANAVAAAGTELLGTSHRQAPVRYLVGELRNGLAELLSLPDGYEIILGNGGTTAFWDAATFCLIDQHSQHLTFGEFSSKFASCAARAPHVATATKVESPVGTHPMPELDPTVDLYALTHNETSTGVAMSTLRRPDGAASGALVAVDATSAAGGLRVNLDDIDAYYFAPQKCLAGEGGLWIAAMSPAAIGRVERLVADRWVPDFLNLQIAVDNSRKDQTYNTPAISTMILANEQVQWILQNGGLEFAASRCDQSAKAIYDWADAHELLSPFVVDADQRSHVVATIDVDDSIIATELCDILRANDIVDTDSYRKLGRNQIRVALFPAIDPEDVQRLTASIDYVLSQLAHNGE